MPFWYADVEPGYCNWIKPEGLICGEKLPDDGVEVMLCNKHLVQAVLASTDHMFKSPRRSRVMKPAPLLDTPTQQDSTNN